MDKLGGHGSFPNGRSDPLHRAVADVTCEEDSRLARFEKVRLPIEQQLAIRPLAREYIRAANQKPVLVPKKPPLRARGRGFPADQNEERVRFEFLSLRR